MSAPDSDLGTCLSGNPAAFGAGSTWQVGDVTTDTISGSGTATLQTYAAQFFFTSSAAARKGLSTIESDYAKCQGTGTAKLVDTVKTTASASSGIAVLRTVRNADGSSASSDTVASDNHEYVAVVGEVLYFLGVYGTAAIDGTSQDATVLQQMDAALAHYGS